jgi:membrane-associated phospholipid phosphatase
LLTAQRPDRRVVHGLRHWTPLCGNRWDSFPSGHAVQLGALATLGSRVAGRRLRPLLWAAALTLAATRVVLLAHYESDVAAALRFGAMVGRAAATALPDVDRHDGRGIAAAD